MQAHENRATVEKEKSFMQASLQTADPNASIVRSKDYELPFSDNPGLFFAAHPNRDPALYGGTNIVATGEGHASYLLLPLISSRP
jgi:hypothetical protein